MMTVNAARLILFALCLSAAGASGGPGAEGKGLLITFPGPNSVAESPDGAYALLNLDRERPDDNGNYHELYLADKKTGDREKILAYGRHVDVMWAPDARHFFVNVHAESDITDAYVFRPDQIASPVDLTEALKKNPRQNTTFLGNEHLYVEATGWTGNETLRFRVHGYGSKNPHGFDQAYRFNIKGEQIYTDKPG